MKMMMIGNVKKRVVEKGKKKLYATVRCFRLKENCKGWVIKLWILKLLLFLFPKSKFKSKSPTSDLMDHPFNFKVDAI